VNLDCILQTGELMTLSPLSGKESQRLQCNLDHPERDDKMWKRDTAIQKEEY